MSASSGPPRGAESGLGSLTFVNAHLDWPEPVTIQALRPQPLPAALDSGPPQVEIVADGTSLGLAEWHRRTACTSLAAVVDGVLVHEWYADGLGPGDLFLGASMTKSVLAQLVGLEEQAGTLRLTDPVIAHVPELEGSGYARAEVGHLLTMTSGVRWVEDHRDPSSAASRLVQMLFTGRGDSRELLRQIRPGLRPGQRFAYNTADSQVLDWVRERAGGQSFGAAVTGLWTALGCETAAAVAVDGAGNAFAGGGLAAATRDWLRIGLLQLHGRVGSGPRLLADDWLRVTSVPPRPFLQPGRLPSSITSHAGFAGHWWPLDGAGRQVTADGSRGQFCYLDRRLGTVVVKTSQWPYGDFLHDRACRDLCYLALPAFAAAVHHSATSHPTRKPEE